MNASQFLTVEMLPAPAAGVAVSGVLGVRPFRRLLDEVWADAAGSLAAVACGLGLRSDEAADVLQDVYLIALQRPPAIGNAGELKGWLYRVTVNRCHLAHRARGRWRKVWQSLAALWQGVSPHEVNGLMASELTAQVQQALAHLPDEERALVALRYFANLNSREIGEILNLPEATVRGRLRGARYKLAELLAEWNDDGT